MLPSVDLSSLKIKTFEELSKILEKEREKGEIIVQCHGVFDLLHPGHIRHFKEAKSLGDKLIVTVTPDRFVNKGPGRPAFSENFRLETLAALEDIDYVVLNETPDAVFAIRQIRPDFYVKGREYRNHEDDITGKINQEVQAVLEFGGKIYYTDNVVFSSSSLLNRYFDSPSPQIAEFISSLKRQHNADEIVKKIEDLSQLKVLVVGDAIVDEYQYVESLGESGKGHHLVGKCLEKETFLGGALIIANHLAQFAGEVTLITALGKECPHLDFIHSRLDPKVQPQYTLLEETTTLIKKRYVLKDGMTLTKLFETYSGQEKGLSSLQSEQICTYLHQHASEYDLVLVCDFGNGFTNVQLIHALSEIPVFLALNTQTNSGNRGFNVATNYRRADYISLNEEELRLSMHDRTSALEGIIADIFQIMKSRVISVTKGVKGVSCFDSSHSVIHIPAFATRSVDRTGAGDCYLSLSSLCLAKGYSPMLAGFVGSIAAAMSVEIIGNQESIQKVPLCKFITRILK